MQSLQTAEEREKVLAMIVDNDVKVFVANAFAEMEFQHIQQMGQVLRSIVNKDVL